MAHLIKENHQFLLSICIPTINRSKQLEQTLNSITNQRIFKESNKIEIVISDNFSNDNTESVAQKFKKNFPNKIVYKKTTENILDKNFEKVLSMASGNYLKLNNDTLKHKENSLEKLVNLIEQNINKKPVLFFSNGALKYNKLLKGEGLNFFISNVSYNSTWIASFGIWKETFDSISDFNKNNKLQLVQTDILFQTVNSEKNIIIDDEVHFETLNISKKGGYDLVEIFFDNYKSLLKRELIQNNITIKVYNKELKKLLMNFFCNWIALIKVYPKKYTFTYTDYKAKFLSNYNYIDFIFFLTKMNLLILKFNLKKCLNIN
jgi:glycosyltransferase involved in cell wall biosynthesis